jgi:hypothetical protein
VLVVQVARPQALLEQTDQIQYSLHQYQSVAAVAVVEMPQMPELGVRVVVVQV